MDSNTPNTPDSVEAKDITKIAAEADDGAKVYQDIQDVEDKEVENDAKAAAVDEMEKASQKALEAMREDNNEKNEKVVNEASKEIDDIFSDFRTWLKDNTQPEKVKAELDSVRERVVNVLNSTKEQVITVAHSEQFKETMESGKNFLLGAGGMISDGFKYGYDKLMEVPEFRKMAGKVDEQVEKVRHSTVLKDIVENTEKGINSLNQSIFDGLKSFFDTDDSKKTGE